MHNKEAYGASEISPDIDRLESPYGFELENTLLSSVRRFDHFATDDTDEMYVMRENGTQQGIFKVWSPQILPLIDRMHDTDTDIDTAIEKWREEMQASPLKLYQSLEQWRAFSDVNDRRLLHIFSQRPMPKEESAAAAELTMRMIVSFGYTAPFYNIEALVADNREENDDNPIDFAAIKQGGGGLDAVAMALPSLLADYIVADTLDWRGLDWPSVHDKLEDMRNEYLSLDTPDPSHPYAVLFRIAQKAHVPPSDVLFAANLLQFIPANVAGKKGNLTVDEARRLIDGAVLDTSSISSQSVARDVNAFIRFLNWTPSQHGDANFSGKMLRYGAVCDTADELVDMLTAEGSQLLHPAFKRAFVEELSPQINGIDATSAKGRLVLQLLGEGKLSSTVERMVKEGFPSFLSEINCALEREKTHESLLNVTDAVYPSYLIGGKAVGIREASDLLGPEAIPETYVISSEAVYEWISSIPHMSELLSVLYDAPSIDDKLSAGECIRYQIENHSTSNDVLERVSEVFHDESALVLRSSSYDEDVDIIGPTPGIYESVTNIASADLHALDRAYRTVVASFFSDKAVSFREMKGLRHVPLMGIIVQPYIPGVGGTVFVDHEGMMTIGVAHTAEAINDMLGVSSVEELRITNKTEGLPTSRYLSHAELNHLVGCAKRTSATLGTVDIEYGVGSDGRMKLLQLRKLRHEKNKRWADINQEISKDIAIVDVSSLPDIDEGEVVRISIDSSIDLEQFQGALFRWITIHKSQVAEIAVSHRIPSTCHFANIVNTLGISLVISYTE